MNIGDDVTINGVVIGMNRILLGGKPVGEEIVVRLKCGTIISVKEKELNTIHPYDEPPKQDMRRGN